MSAPKFQLGEVRRLLVHCVQQVGRERCALILADLGLDRVQHMLPNHYDRMHALCSEALREAGLPVPTDAQMLHERTT